MTSRISYTQLVWATLVFTLFVVIWGGYVSASGAGDGCGDSWPLCRNLLGASTPTTPVDTLVELTHRLTSGLALLAVVGLTLWSRRRFPPRHRARYWAALALFFMVVESLLGAALVIFRLVDLNVSLARALIQPVHLTNTYLLMGSLAFAAWWSGPRRSLPGSAHRLSTRFVVAALVGVVVLSAFGTVASLASTVFPSESFLDGVRNDFIRDAHYLVRLRIGHPIAALVFGGYLFWLGRRLTPERPERTPFQYYVVTGIFAAQVGVGLLDAILLAPIGLQMAHLFLAHALWLSLLKLWLDLVSEPLGRDRPVLDRRDRTDSTPQQGVTLT
jgi:heme A synthase